MQLLRRALSGALLLAGLAVLPGVSVASAAPTSAGFPVIVHTSKGAVTIPSRPTSIVSLSATATEMLYAIGAGAQVRAVDKYSTYPAGAPVTNLDGFTASGEALAKYKPDLVVVSYEPSGFVSQMAKLKIPVLYEPAAATIAQSYAQYLGLGRATGHYLQAQNEVRKVRATITSIVRSTPKAAPGTTYYWELDPTYYSVTSATFMGQLMSLLGLKSIADSGGLHASGGYPQLTSEFILQANPTYIFLADTLCCQATPASVAARPGWSAMSAVSGSRILGLNDNIASNWGPRIAVLLQQVSNFVKAHQG